MHYLVYIGNNQATISHYTQIVDGVFITTDREEKANDILSNIREQYNTVVLFEQGKDTESIRKHTLFWLRRSYSQNYEYNIKRLALETPYHRKQTKVVSLK
mgnify:CR=1 FL=1